MQQWGVYVAYAWLATIVYAFMDAVQAIRKGPVLQSAEPRTRSELIV
jgi:hypothetical protein